VEDRLLEVVHLHRGGEAQRELVRESQTERHVGDREQLPRPERLRHRAHDDVARVERRERGVEVPEAERVGVAEPVVADVREPVDVHELDAVRLEQRHRARVEVRTDESLGAGRARVAHGREAGVGLDQRERAERGADLRLGVRGGRSEEQAGQDQAGERPRADLEKPVHHFTTANLPVKPGWPGASTRYT
jgi:hypothetical protein